ncbi:hypothetical protein D9M73_251710 [compost metagenome]
MPRGFNKAGWVLLVKNLDRPRAVEVNGAAQVQAIGGGNDGLDRHRGGEVLD